MTSASKTKLMEDISLIINQLGEERDLYYQAVSPPIMQTSNFAFKDFASMRSTFEDEYAGDYIYTKAKNPTVDMLRLKLAALQGAEDALVTNSGSSAIFCSILANVKAGDHILEIGCGWGAFAEYAASQYGCFVTGISLSKEQLATADVMRQFERMLERDHAKTKITQVSELGLVEMTRKRTRESLEHLLCESCPTCQGRGYVKTAETVCYEIFRVILRYTRAYESKSGFTVIGHPSVIDRLLTAEAPAVADLEHFVNRVIKFQVENLYTQEQYDIILS